MSDTDGGRVMPLRMGTTRIELQTLLGRISYGHMEVDPRPDGSVGLSFHSVWDDGPHRFGVALMPDAVDALKAALTATEAASKGEQHG
jgi:hypothetical protein